MAPSPWTDEKIAELKKLVLGRNHSYTDIGKILGFTKGQIAGRIDRMNKKAKRTGKEPISTPKPKRRVFSLHAKPSSKAASKTPPVKVIEKKPELTPLLPPETYGKSGTCTYMWGDPAKPGWVFCGRPGYPWCEEHRRQAYQPVTPRIRM